MPKICEFEACRKFANYGKFYGKPIRCKEHKDIFKLSSSLCKENNCVRQPIYNYEGERRAFYCFEHKKENMINVKDKKCIHPNCKIIPNYNYEGETNSLYCTEHKKENMINIKSKKCIHSNCKIIPNYNYEGKTTALYCNEHKKENMIDIKSKKCIHPNCKKTSSYNYQGKTERLYCSEHKKENMLDIKTKKCIHTNCKIRPNYNYEGQTNGLYCSNHKLEVMVNVVNKKCKGNYCLGASANPKYKGYCASCYQHLFPNDPLTLQIRSKTKEIAVRDYINLNFEGFQHDKPLWTGNCDCTHRRRIDHRKIIGNTLLCIETDENQHKDYNKTDEEVRYDDLFMLHGGKFIYIRFNPDKFKDNNGKSINPMLYSRLPILKEEVEKQIKRIENEENKELLEIIKLYYDSYN
jgi:hypothetical protein